MPIIRTIVVRKGFPSYNGLLSNQNDMIETVKIGDNRNEVGFTMMIDEAGHIPTTFGIHNKLFSTITCNGVAVSIVADVKVGATIAYYPGILSDVGERRKIFHRHKSMSDFFGYQDEL